MRSARILLPPLVLLTSGPLLPAQELVDQLSPDALQEAFRVLQKDYIRKDALSYTNLNRAALDGLLRDLDSGAQLVTISPDEENQTPAVQFLGDMLSPRIAYLRPAEWQTEEIEKVDETLKAFRKGGAESLILDLRVPQPDTDLSAAAMLVSRFVEPDQLLFRIEYPDRKPSLFLSTPSEVRWEKEVVILVDSETSNAGELVAASLKSRIPCLIVGQPTPGVTVEYHEIPLNENTRLRYAAAEVLLSDGTSLFQKGVVPDIELPADQEDKHRIYSSTPDEPVQHFIFEKPRPRLSEAALVQGTDPELDYHVARAKGEATQWDKVPLQDNQIQRAVDLLVASRHLDESRSEQD